MADEKEEKAKHPFIEKVNAAKNLILAIVALLAAVSSWLKPQDQTATKNSYEWSAAQIEKLAANDVKLQEDLVGLRNYIQGYALARQSQDSQNPQNPQRPTTEGTVGLGSGSGFGSGAGGLSARAARRRPPRAAGSATPPEVAEPTVPTEAPQFFQAIEPQELPAMQAAPQEVEAPKFEEIAK